MVGRSKAMRNYMKSIMSDECPWCVVSASTVGWAKRLYPELNDEEAYLKLWDQILSACRSTGDDPVAEWEDHIKVLDEKAKFLHENELVKLHITNDLGTDLYVGLPKNHIWQSAGSYAKKADRFVANIPTEEVFTMPHKDETSGIVYNAKPLNYSGVLIDNFWLKFEDGKVTEKAKGNSDKKYYLALPNGKKVFFTDSDIHYWKKDDSVVGFTHDLALIKLREVIDDVKSADVVTSVPTVNNGDKVSVYGYPDGKMGPVIDTTVTDVVDRGAGLTGIGYTGTKPGASGGGLYNDKGEIIGVHQNGVVNQRSGGLVFSKEQFDWVRSYVNGKPEAPVL